MKNKEVEILIVKGGSRGEIEGVELVTTSLTFEEFCKDYADKALALFTEIMLDAERTAEDVVELVEEFRVGDWYIETSDKGTVHCMVSIDEEECDDLILVSSISEEDKKDLLKEGEYGYWEDIYAKLGY